MIIVNTYGTLYGKAIDLIPELRVSIMEVGFTGILTVGFGLINVADCFDKPNPFNKSQWEPKIPHPSELLNESYHAAMETALLMLWRQRRHIDTVDHYRQKINQQLDGIEIQPFDDLLNDTMKLIGSEVLIIQDIIWGQRKEKRNPLDRSMVDQLSEKFKTMQASLDEKRLPTSLLKETKENFGVSEFLNDIRATLKLANEELPAQFAKIEKAVADVETGTVGRVTAMKWNHNIEPGLSLYY